MVRGLASRVMRWTLLVDLTIVSLVGLALRLPFTAQTLWAWDSVLYARAIADFHMGEGLLEQRPQPPGYFLYVLAARAATAFLGDANTGLVAVSLVAGVLAIGAAYLVGRTFGGRIAGLAASAVLIADPVLWQASVVAYPYALLALFGGALGLAFWHARRRGFLAIVAASALFGVALGFRQDLAAYLGPLWLVTVASRGWRALLAGALACAVAALLWVVPSAIASGGLDRYVSLVIAQALGASELGKGALPLVRNVDIAATGLRWQFLWLWPLIFAGAWLVLRARRAAALFFAVWIVPAAAVIVFHVGEPAYTLALAVPLAALAGIGLEAVARVRPRPLRSVLTACAAALVLALAGTFVLGTGRFSAASIRAHDRIISTQVAAVRAAYDPANTVILARANFLHALHYLPEYRAVYVPSQREGGRAKQLVKALAGPSRGILFDNSHPLLRRLATRLGLATDVDLYVIPVGPRVLAALADDEEELSLD